MRCFNRTNRKPMVIRSLQFVLLSRHSFVFLLLIVSFLLTLLHRFSYLVMEGRKAIATNQLTSCCSFQETYESNLLSNHADFATFDAFFSRATAGRNSSYPFISGDTFRAMADHIFDETTNVTQWRHRASKIARGEVVFLSGETDLMKLFFGSSVFKRIRHPFILVTHNSDASAPTDVFKWVLDDDKVLTWFATNPDYVHRKLFPVPIGIANTRWPHGNVTNFKKAFLLNRKSFSERPTLLYVNFKVANNIKARSKALKWALSLPNVLQSQTTSHESYLRELGSAKFVVSPPGNGLDCHRTWEAILMGAVPIVLRSPLDPLFSNTPVLIVDDWSYITVEYLQSLHFNSVISERLFAKYWYRRLKNVQRAAASSEV